MNIISGIIGVIICLLLKKSLIIKKNNFGIILLASILGPILGYLLFLYLINKTNNVSIVITLAFTSPLWSIIIGYLFFKERLKLKQILGVIFIVFGICIMTRFN